MVIFFGIVICRVIGLCVIVCDCVMVSFVEMNSFKKVIIIIDFEIKGLEKFL